MVPMSGMSSNTIHNLSDRLTSPHTQPTRQSYQPLSIQNLNQRLELNRTASPTHSVQSIQSSNPPHTTDTQETATQIDGDAYHETPRDNLIQTTLTDSTDNLPFGDILSNVKPANSIRIVLQNVNGIHKAKSWLELNKLATNIKELEIDIFGAVETNLKWNFKNNNIA
jgi:hypothetical protein